MSGLALVALEAKIDTQKVTQFVQAHQLARALSPAEYGNFISLGAKTVKTILDGGKQPAFNRQKYMQDIVNVLWCLYAIAVTKDQGFTHGVIVIEDPNQKLYNYFLEYVKHVNPSGLTKKVTASTNPYAYARISTHFADAQKKYTQYGIDIRLEDNGKAKELLPGNGTHLLFGRLDSTHFFIKMEDHGLYIKDGFVGHVGGFISSVGRKVGAALTGGKTEDPLARKEHVPTAIKKEYEKICKDNKLSAKAKTIKDMVVQSSKDGVLISFVSKLAGRYDHLPLRYGNEVILMQQDLR
jgi:hypothetical protein